MAIKYKKTYRNLDLRRTNFKQTCLIGCKFINCNLGFCSFEHADLSYTTFEHCDLYNVKFNNAVMYSTCLYDCDCTKTSFCDAYLNGLKTKNIFIVHTEFGYSFNTGKERKPIEYSKKEDSFFEAKLGPIPMNVSEIEDTFNGIYCPNTQIAIRFIDTENDKQRVWVRKSEIAKTIKLILEQNGYNDKALDYYFFHRRFRRKTISSWFKRWSELLWGELFWGYGVKIINPVITFFINTILFSVIYSLLPYNLYLTEAGMSINNKLVYIYNTDTGVLISEYLKILYGSFLISSLSIFGSVDVHGIACLFAIIQIQISILLLGLGVTALGKRMSNI